MTQLAGVEVESIRESSSDATQSSTQSLGQTSKADVPKFTPLMDAASETGSDLEMPPMNGSSPPHAPASSALMEIVSEIDSEIEKPIQPIRTFHTFFEVEPSPQTPSAPAPVHEQSFSLSASTKKKKSKSNKSNGLNMAGAYKLL